MLRKTGFFKAPALIVLAFVCALVFPLQAPASSPSDDIPLAAHLTLSKVSSLMNQKEYDRAIETLTKFQGRGAKPLGPDDPDPKGCHHYMIYFVLGNCYLIQERYEAAATAYRKGLTRNPNHNASWLNLAKACYESKNFCEAGKCFARGYDTSEQKQPDNLYFSAVAFFMARQYDSSIAAFERLYKNHREAIKPEWKENFVHVLLAAEQPRRALPIIIELVQQHTGENRIRWQEMLLQMYLQLNMHDKALNYALELTRENPTLPKWWKALAHVQLNKSRYKQALTAMTVYAWLTPLSDEEQKLLADLNLQLGIPVKAAPLYEKLLDRKPDKRVLKNLALACQQLDKVEEALECMQRFRGSEKEADLMMLKGDLLYAMGRYEDAADSYRRAAENEDRQAGRAWLMAGYSAWRINDLDASRRAFKRAANDPKQKKAALDALKRIK